MRITSSVAPIDQPIEEAAKERPGLALKIRLQPAIFRVPEGAPKGHFQAWRQLHWMVEPDTLDEARRFREALHLFFTLVTELGIGAVYDKLQELSFSARNSVASGT